MPRRPKDLPPPRDPQQIIEDLRRENERLREDMRRSEIGATGCAAKTSG